jgi:urease accessory protein UreE
MEQESLNDDQRELIAIVASLHDIGAMEAQRKYGSMEAEYQEKEGPAVAREILRKIGYDPARTDRVCYIIGNHHTPARIDGVDFQIQWSGKE